MRLPYVALLSVALFACATSSSNAPSSNLNHTNSKATAHNNSDQAIAIDIEGLRRETDRAQAYFAQTIVERTQGECFDAPDRYGLSAEHPLEVGPLAGLDGTLFGGNVLCSDGVIPKVEHAGYTTKSASYKPLGAAILSQGDYIDVWHVQCGTTTLTVYSYLYRMGPLCAPKTLSLIPVRAMSSFRRAVALFRRGDAVEALAQINVSLRAAGIVDRFLHFKGILLMAHERYSEAKDAFSNALKLSPNDPYFRMHYAIALMFTGDRVGYVTTIRHLHKTLPANHPLRDELACQLVASEHTWDHGQEGVRLAYLACKLGRDTK